MEQVFELEIVSVIHETHDVLTVQLKPADQKLFAYRPGQFLTMIFNIRGKEIRRSFSFSSTPGIDPVIAFTVKRIPNGEISNYIYSHLKVGDAIKAIHASGRFVLDYAQSKRDVFMVAAGSGITPVYSIIKDLIANDPLSRIVLIYSNRDENSTIFYHQLNELSSSYPERFNLIYIFSAPLNKEQKYKGHLGLELLQSLISENMIYNTSGIEFMLCGPFDYMRKSEMILIAMGFGRNHIHKENFTIIAEQQAINAAPAQVPGEKTVIIYLKDQKLELAVPVGKPILKTALEQGIPLPYSCQGGICGTCSAMCTGGKIAMSINDVLTAKELSQGWVLTCVGYPISDRAEIRYD